MPLSTIIPLTRERGQLVVEVGPTTGVAQVSLGVPSSILAKRKQDDNTWVFECKKLRTSSSF